MIWCEAPLCTPLKWASYMRLAKGEVQDRIGSGIYSMPLQSVYIGELKCGTLSRDWQNTSYLAFCVHVRVEIGVLHIF